MALAISLYVALGSCVPLPDLRYKIQYVYFAVFAIIQNNLKEVTDIQIVFYT